VQADIHTLATTVYDTPTQSKPRQYSGMVSPEYYCTSCTQSIQLTNARLQPHYCPYCGSTDLITDQARFRLDYSHSLKIHPTVYDMLLKDFRAQRVYLSFREYTQVICFGASPISNTEYNKSLARKG
jgi:predicted RNA-binding Zn-ribbon protein involved in translation (DUF1610 family)